MSRSVRIPDQPFSRLGADLIEKVGPANYSLLDPNTRSLRGSEGRGTVVDLSRRRQWASGSTQRLGDTKSEHTGQQRCERPALPDETPWASDQPDELLFDWDGDHESAINVDALLAEQENSTPDPLAERWAQRAAKLACIPPQEEDGEQVSLVFFHLGREVYGVDAKFVTQIRPMEGITPVPRAPDWVAGVANLRGRIVSVVDLQRFFGFSSTRLNWNDGHSRWPVKDILVVESTEVEMGLLVDSVVQVEATPIGRIQTPGGTIRSLPPDYVWGLLKLNDELDDPACHAVVLNLAAMLKDRRLIIHEDV